MMAMAAMAFSFFKFNWLNSLYFLLMVLNTTVNNAESSSLKFEPRPISSSSDEKILACYYRNHIIDDNLVPANVCTHVIFAFAKVSQNGIVPLHPTDFSSYRALAKLKDRNPKLKVLICLQTGFPSVVSFGTEAMLKFSLSTIPFLNKYKFDGVDLDWEFPDIVEKQAYSEFIMILSTVLHWSNKSLSLALPNNQNLFEQAFFPDTINKYADFVTAMTYDFHSYVKKHSNLTDFNSPLYSPTGDDPFACTAGAIDYYLFRGVSASKILLGFPTYARTCELANASVHGVHAPAVGLGTPGPVTNSTGYYFLQDICVAQEKGGKVVQNISVGAEYLYYGKTWAAFNGFYSAAIKTDWLKKRNLAGVGVWTLEDDDPHNVCGGGPFPVLQKLRSYL